MAERAPTIRPYRMYPRYGGLSQSCPLTEEEKRYDETCRAIDYAEERIKELPLNLFMAGEFMWFNWFSTKMFVCPAQPQLDKQLVQIGDLLHALEKRKSGVTE